MANFEWNDELREKAVSMYTELNPTPENTIECVKEVGDALGTTVNSVRMILSKAGVYVKTAAPEPKAAKKTGTRVSKQEALDELKAAISDVGQEVDDSIIDKLTGKAAVYFTGVLRGNMLENE